MQRRVVDLDASLLHHLLDLAVAERIRHIPAHAPQDHVTLEVAALELDRHHPPDLNQGSDPIPDHSHPKLATESAGDPDLLAMYVTRRADDGVAVSTLRVDLAAIRTAHRLAGIPLDLHDPRLAMVVEGITRRLGTRPRRQVAAAVPDVLRRLLAACASTGTALGARDRAMLLLGFGAALRRSELVALQLGDLEIIPNRGIRLLVRRSKTDQHGQGQDVAVWANPADPLLCPVAAVSAWRRHRDQARDLQGPVPETVRRERPLFCAVTKADRATGTILSDKAVARLVKGAASKAGLDPERYSGHSLRAGLATAAGDAGAALPDLMRQTPNKS
jgi:integrase